MLVNGQKPQAEGEDQGNPAGDPDGREHVSQQDVEGAAQQNGRGVDLPRHQQRNPTSQDIPDDTAADATDCKAAVDAGTASIRTVYTPEYAAGAPYDSSAIDFGDNTSDYADDAVCDDPRFEGPGVAGYVIDDDLKRDSADCKTAFEAGQIVLIEAAGES